MSVPATSRPEFVDFHLDMMCPYAYQASVWIREVRALTGLASNWRFFSLEEINRAEGKKHPWEREWSYGGSLMRIGALLRRHGMDLLDSWYAAVGAALHVRGVPTLFFPDGQCLFGPVLIDPPTGQDAERLWDAVLAWTAFPHLYEIQRPKGRADAEQIAAAFGPYLRARDWVSIDRGAVVEFAVPAVGSSR